MHPILFRIGNFPVGTYGLLLVIAFFSALALAKRQGRMDGLSGDAIVDLSITLLLAGVVGAKVLMVVVDVSGGARLQDAFSLDTLRAGGAVHGGIIAGAIALFWRARKLKLNLPLTLDACVPAVALGQAIGRLGCFSAGCCYGSESHSALAVIFTNPDAHMLSGTPLDLPIHPVQLYTFCMNLAVMGLLLLVRKHRRFTGQVLASYFVLEGLGRALMETWRGDLDRGVWFAGLSTGRVTALLFIIAGIILWFWFRRSYAAPKEA
ncbi:prolipoprotein diacylglyceryl transferase [Holophaga foetida]|uniref:prolipoprotein diacylglyceryl transferase n=1 Tax=Holophaga foetida TaxID=35839 RepID=UPI00024732D7|nr:prolipoprotein diacylglyceryl transferase [Holophaga foetida]